MSGHSLASGWHYARAGSPEPEQVGPVSWEEVWALAQSGGLTRTDLVWHQALPGWVPVDQVAGLFSAAQTVPAGPDVRGRAGRRHFWLLWAVPLAVLMLAGAGLAIYFTTSGQAGIDSFVTVNGVELRVLTVELPKSYDTGVSTIRPQSSADTLVAVGCEMKGEDLDNPIRPSLVDENGGDGHLALTEKTFSPQGTGEVTWVFVASKSAKSYTLGLPDGQMVVLDSLISR